VPFNGAGTFSLVAGNPVVTGTVISSTWANNTLSDLAANGLTNCLTKDGQQTPTANIPLGGFQLTGVGSATTRGAAPNAGQIQDGGLLTLGTVSGTDTITAASSPSITAYVAGQTFNLIAVGANTTSSVTLNISGVGAKSIKKIGPSGLVSLSPGDIQTGQILEVFYDGTQFQVISTNAPNVPIPFCNKFVNGNLDVWQRGAFFTNATTPANSYTADCWQVYRDTFGNNYNVQRVTTSPTGSSFGMQIQRSVGDTSTNRINVSQSFETSDVTKFSLRTLTLSFQVLATGAFIGLPYFAQVQYGTGIDGSLPGGFTGLTLGPSSTQALTSGFTQQTLTFTVPAGVSQMAIFLSLTPSSTAAGANDTIKLAQLQLNEGASPLPFERRQFREEFALCKHYYSTIFPVMHGYNSAGATSGYSIIFTDMRANPTVTFNAGATFSNASGGSAFAIKGANSFELGVTVTALGSFFADFTANGITLNASL
jgi:hypothetical protein